MKNKNVAGALAITLGIFGVHRFYLGQRKLGFLYIAIFAFGVVHFANVHYWWDAPPLFMIPMLIGFIDSVLFFAMPKLEFDEKFNAVRSKRDFRKERPPFRRERNRGKYPVKYPNPYKVSGLEKYRDYDYDGAIEDFQEALRVNYEDPALHFNLACCYSINEQADEAFFHLDKSVAFGFDDFEKIHNHDALAYLRTQEDFEGFVNNKYRVVAKLPEPQEEILSDEVTPLFDQKVLEKIASLGELRDKGFLTEEEFSSQKKRLLRMERER